MTKQSSIPFLKSLTIENYRSIGEIPLTINFRKGHPTIFIGENNAGKSNIIRAIDIMFGEWFPKYKEFEDHDYHGRTPEAGTKIIIKAEVSGFQNRLGRNQEFTCGGFVLESQKKVGNIYNAIESESGEGNRYVSNELRNELSCVLVNSEQNLSYQLSYSSKYTLLSRVTKAFHDKLVSDESRVERLKSLFSEIVSTFATVPEFSEFKQNMSSIAGEMISNMSHGLDLDFSAYDPSNYFKALRVHPHEAENIRTFEELGTGQQQILALSFAHAYAKSFKGKGLLLLLDEPEAHLHPLAQKWLGRTMFQMCKDGLQILITTHSPYFVDLEFLEGIHLIKKDESDTLAHSVDKYALAKYCIEKGSNPDKTNAEHIVSFYAGNATDNITKGFFANKIVLVEGPTEELALPIYLKKAGLDTLQEGIDIIHVGGKGNLAKWWRFFTFFEIPVFVCFDNDSGDDPKKVKRTEALRSIGIEETNIEDILTSDDWNINDFFCAFGKDFETTLRNTLPKYIHLEEKAKESLGDSKPIVARSVANNIEYNPEVEGWKYFSDLADKIRQLGI